MLLPIKKQFFNTKSPLTPLNSQRGGGGVILVLVMVVVGFLSMMGIFKNLEISRNMIYRNAQLETRKQAVQKIKNLLASDYIIDYSINTFNRPADNSLLKDCIMASNPTVGTVCTNVPVSFYSMVTNTISERFLGSDDSPTFLTQFGEVCDPANTSCVFRATSKCSFSCPSDQAICAAVKVMRCDLEVAPAGNQVFRTLLMSKERSDFATEISLQIAPTLDRYYIFRL